MTIPFVVGRSIKLTRSDLRAALRGLVLGLLAMALWSAAQGVLAREVPPDRPFDRYGAPWTRPALWSYVREVVEPLTTLDLMAWGEAWVPVEWRAWARPEEDLSWPPRPVWTGCPPGAYCDPDIPDTICDVWPDDWRSSTPACPFEAAPIAQLPWAVGNLYGQVVDATGQPMWLGCQVVEGRWRIALIEVGPDGEALSEDDVVRGCRGPHLGWPQEFWAGWPVNESVMRTGEVR